VEIQPNWFINRKAEFSLVETVANKKGFRRSEKKSSHWLKQLANGKSLRGLGDLQGETNSFCLQRRVFRDLMKVASRAER